MSAPESLYPPTPPGVPEGLTDPSPAYRRQVGVVLASLMAFLFLYLGLIVGIIWLLLWVFSIPLLPGGLGWPNRISHQAPPRMPQAPQNPGPRFSNPPPTFRQQNRPSFVPSDRPAGASPSENVAGFMLFKLLFAVPLGLLLLFLVKGLFKTQRPGFKHEVEVDLRDHPDLADFIDRLCEDTQAPPPHRVFVSPEVNAAVFHDTSVLNLIVPPRKNLLIGLGLVNALTISEFKAVLAHEFGHFSQSSLQLGSYVYLANKIVGDMVFGRDFFDAWVERMRHSENALMALGWTLHGLTWTLRQGLILVFKGINLANAKLSREMEFHADLVAVSVTGSDALIHALSRLDFAGEALERAAEELSHAAQDKIYTNDLFYHQRLAFAHLRRQKNKPTLGEPPPLPRDPRQRSQVFTSEDDDVPDMWASHPANFDREENAKAHYVRSPEDDRTPWLLFTDPAALRHKATARFNRAAFGLKDRKKVRPAAEVQQFIEAERAETSHDPKYRGFYDARLIEPGSIDDAEREGAWSDADLASLAENIYPLDLDEMMEKHERRKKEAGKLAARMAEDPALRQRFFLFRGKEYVSGEEKRLLKKVRKELDREHEEFERIDAQVCRVHFQLARRLSPALLAELGERYRFQKCAQAIGKRLMKHQDFVTDLLERLSGVTILSETEMDRAVEVLRSAQQTLKECARDARDLTLPPLTNLPTGQPLRDYLIARDVLADFDAAHDEGRISGKWLNKLLKQYGEALDRGKRLHYKSLGALLLLQEQLVQEWKRRRKR